MCSFRGWTAEDAKTYAGLLQRAGFDRGAEERDLTSMGIYSFSASNREYTVTAMSASGQGGIEIEPTDLEDLLGGMDLNSLMGMSGS